MRDVAGIAKICTAGLEVKFFAFWSPLKTFFYKKTYAKTFVENRPFLCILGHDAEVRGSASTDTTPRSCHVTDDPGRRRHGGAWGPTRRRCVSQRHRPNLGAVGLHAELLAPSGARPRRPNNASWPNSSARGHLTPSHQTRRGPTQRRGLDS